ncbi:MAG TPA: hypothetical protein VFP94_05535 [Terriglobales bacterium]|nr:hypothetical protein [Terriglobales bacterium]
MVYCPACEATMDLDEDQLQEGGVLSCDGCGIRMEVVNVNPLQLEKLDGEDEDELEDDDLDDEDGDLDDEDEEDEDEDEDEEDGYDDEDDDFGSDEDDEE